ncbi:MAG: butyrate kinase [bacterium]|nr:butyrate kinase [bacterium]
MVEVIFSVNPGATTTKCSIYRIFENGVKEVFSENIEHPTEEIKSFKDITSQVDYRYEKVENFLKDNLKSNYKIVATAGRGGMLTPVPSGVIKINEELVNFSLYTPVYQHASNLGAPLAYRVAKKNGVDSFIVDPVSVDEFKDVARISGAKDFPRFSFVHALNIRATVRKLSEILGIDFNSIKCVVAHLGAGFSIAAFVDGKIVDNDNRMESAPFTAERAGGVPPIPLVNACFSGKFTKEQILKKLYGEGGLYGYLRTKDLREVLRMIEGGDKYAELIYNAMIYQIAKEIGSMASVMNFEMDGIILTGGMAYSGKLVKDISKKVEKIGKIYVFPGSNENEALALGVYRVLKGEERYLTWPVKV